MTEPLNPDFCVKCQRCGKDFEMVWGTDNLICEDCKTVDSVPPVEEETLVTLTYPEYRELFDKVQFYSNPDNWRRFPVDEGFDGNGSPVPQWMWIGDGGEFARSQSSDL